MPAQRLLLHLSRAAAWVVLFNVALSAPWGVPWLLGVALAATLVGLTTLALQCLGGGQDTGPPVP